MMFTAVLHLHQNVLLMPSEFSVTHINDLLTIDLFRLEYDHNYSSKVMMNHVGFQETAGLCLGTYGRCDPTARALLSPYINNQIRDKMLIETLKINKNKKTAHNKKV